MNSPLDSTKRWGLSWKAGVPIMLMAVLCEGCGSDTLYDLKLTLPSMPAPTLAEKLTLLTATARRVDEKGDPVNDVDTIPLCLVLTTESGWLTCPDVTCASGGQRSINLAVPKGPNRIAFAPYHIPDSGKDIARVWLYQSISTTCASDGALLLATQGLEINIK